MLKIINFVKVESETKMKKTILFLCLAAGLLSCTKEQAPRQESAGNPMRFEISVAGTKASKTDWAVGDVVYVFFSGLETKYLSLTLGESGWVEASEGGTLTADDFAALSDQYITAVHFPCAVEVSYDDESFHFTRGGEPVYTYDLSALLVPYTVEGTTVRATIQLNKPGDVALFHVPGLTEEDAATFSSPLLEPYGLESASIRGYLSLNSGEAGEPLGVFYDADGAVFTGLLTTTFADDYEFIVSLDGATYTLTRKDRTLEPDKMYNFPALDDPAWSVFELYVDLGLESGTKWATMNVGATRPEEYGDHFSWAETAPKTDYSWSNYAWMKAGESEWYYITKYTGPDGQKEGIWYDGDDFIGDIGEEERMEAFKKYEYADDAARVNWGEKWRMPTHEESMELKDACSWVWTDNYNDTGVPGDIVTGPNGKSIFFPAAGIYDGTELYDADEFGSFWSGSLDPHQSWYAWGIYFFNERVDFVEQERSFGMSVRPVLAEE